MFSAVPPVQNVESNTDSDGTEGKIETVSKDGAKLKATVSVSPSRAPSGVSQENWKKFQELRERRTKCCQSKTAEKRIRKLKKDVTKTVFSQMKHPDELAVLEDRGLVAPCQHTKQQQTNRSSSNVSETISENELKWKQLIHYSSASSRCSAKGEEAVEKVSKGICEEKRLEEQVENAIRHGNLHEAEEINKQLVQHQFASKLVRAVECRDYVKRKAAEEEKAKKKKKTKLHWGFEQKQRWESKGNM